MPTVTTADGTEIYYKDWGEGSPADLLAFARGEVVGEPGRAAAGVAS